MIDLVQGTAERKQARLGKVTASRIADLMAKTKTGWGASRANLMAALIAERLTGVAMENYTNAAMAWGTDTEPQARMAYEFYVDAEVAQVGFVQHPTIAASGASPDGHIGEDGSLELKCPQTNTHIDTLLGQSVPSKYILQMQWQLACSGRSWCDFVSYDPRLPPSMQLFVRRVPRDDKMIAELETAVREFLGEMESKIAKLLDLYEKAEAA